MVLYHELGHLVFHQPRGGYITLVFGSALPLLWLVQAGHNWNLAVFASLIAICTLELMSLVLLNGLQREVFADEFALASKFTEIWVGLSKSEIDEIEQRGQIFEDKPATMTAYETVVTARNRVRGLMFRLSYRRMNKVGWLNRKYIEFDRKAGGADPYWGEMFYRRALQGVALSPRFALSIIKFLFLIFMASHLSEIYLSGGCCGSYWGARLP